MQSEVFQAFIC